MSEDNGLAGRCCTCGIKLVNCRRRYCSDECQKQLKDALWFSESFLRALDTKFASFKWTEQRLILQLLPFNNDNMFCFFYTRTNLKTKPAVDLRKMILELSEKWWTTFRATKSHYNASCSLLNDSACKTKDHELTFPEENETVPAGVDLNNLVALELTSDDLIAGNREERIKKAYWKKAKISHPDIGGDGEQFRRIQESFELLKAWSDKPEFFDQKKKLSLPDGWLFNNCCQKSKKWIPPTGRKGGAMLNKPKALC